MRTRWPSRRSRGSSLSSSTSFPEAPTNCSFTAVAISAGVTRRPAAVAAAVTPAMHRATSTSSTPRRWYGWLHTFRSSITMFISDGPDPPPPAAEVEARKAVLRSYTAR